RSSTRACSRGSRRATRSSPRPAHRRRPRRRRRRARHHHRRIVFRTRRRISPSGWPLPAKARAIAAQLPTNVVTDVAPSAAVKDPLLFPVTAVLEARLSIDDVPHGVTIAGAVPPEIVMGTLTAEVFLLMATMAMAVPVPLKAEMRTPEGAPVTSTRTKLGR